MSDTDARGDISVGWTTRTVPLAPLVVVAENAKVAAALVRRTLEYPDTTLEQWAGVATPSQMVALLALRPNAPDLPWVDGVHYLGRDPAAPSSFYLPTTVQPTVPAPLFYRALRLRLADVTEPFAVWPSQSNSHGLTLLSLHEARALDRDVLAVWK